MFMSAKQPISGLTAVINAAGKLTALGGSAQTANIAESQALMAQQHVDLAELRNLAAQRIAEPACITTGAAAGTAISVAGLITGMNLDLVSQLPGTEQEHYVLLQAGHNINFGAPIEQMLRLGGGLPWVLGSTNNVTERLLIDTLEREEFLALLYVQSHHCVQSNQISLARCVEICHQYNTPVIVDAAAEEDLRRYIATGADLVTYSGGKALGGPTSGFIVGRRDLIAACELQFQGIARTMKVGKEAIVGLLAAMEHYVTESDSVRAARFAENNRLLMEKLEGCSHLHTRRQADEAGRPFERIAVSPVDGDVRDLVNYLRGDTPSIRTRNHHIDEGYLLIDPREMNQVQVTIVAERLKAYQPS